VLALALERRATENLEARVRHAGAPERFMESELDLDDAVRGVAGLAACPELFPVFVELGAVPTLLGLLGHANASLAADVVDVVRELTDAEALGAHPAEARVMAEALLEGGVLESLAGRLGGLDEGVAEEATAVFNALAVFENLLEVAPEGAGARLAGEACDALGWLLRRTARAEHDSNRLAAAELTAILLHRGGAARARLLDCDGVELLLQSAARYKRRDPEAGEEEEYVENVFGALCSVASGGGAPGASAADAVGRAFLEAEGLELLALLLRKKCFARHCTLKVLDFALNGVPGAPERFVRAGGLGGLFALFMGRGLSRRTRWEEGSGSTEFTERVVSALAALLGHLPRGPERDRVYAKFREAGLEKVDRLVELWARYFDVLEGQDPAGAPGPEPEDAYVHRLDGGLHTLQHLSLVVGSLWGMGDPDVRARLLFVLHQQGLSLTLVAEVLDEQLEFQGAAEAEAEAEAGRAGGAGQAAREAREARAQRLQGLVRALRVPA